VANLRLPSTDFWKGRRVLVTGHTGFKGGWLVVWLHKLGADVKGISLPPSTDPSFFSLAGVEGFCQHALVDIRDSEQTNKEIKTFQPEIVFHLAAQSLVRQAYLDPEKAFATNVMGTLNVLMACKPLNALKSIVVVTTDKVYKNPNSGKAFVETDELGGDNPYSCSKAAAELVCGSFRKEFLNSEIGLATARAGNVIGGGDWCVDRIIPDAVRAAHDKMPLSIRMPNAIRPWQHVVDVLGGYLLLAESLAENPTEFSEAWNFGPPEQNEYSVRDLIENFSKHLEDRLTWIVEDSDVENFPESRTLKLNSGKAISKLDWQPVFDFAAAVERTALWYECWLSGAGGEKLSQTNSDDIARFGKTV
jgi:CDP-glucose 4,6-dehydratase